MPGPRSQPTPVLSAVGTGIRTRGERPIALCHRFPFRCLPLRDPTNQPAIAFGRRRQHCGAPLPSTVLRTLSTRQSEGSSVLGGDRPPLCTATKFADGTWAAPLRREMADRAGGKPMFRAKPALSRMGRQLWAILTKKSSRPPQMLGDPAASRPQDLDDPFV